MIKYISYSGLNKMLFSPKLYYKHYILGEKEDSIDSWAIDGNLFDCYMTNESEFFSRFSIVPGVIPSDNTKKLVYKIYKDFPVGSDDLSTYRTQILEELVNINLHQSLKTDEQRLEKILTPDAINYFKFLKSSENKIVVDNEQVIAAKTRAELIKQDAKCSSKLALGGSDFNVEVVTQKMFYHELNGKYPFTLRGIPDRIVIDHKNKKIKIFDIKTTGKTLDDFYPDTYEYLKYDLQSAIYYTLIGNEYKNSDLKDYTVSFEFFVIDKYDQYAFFEISHAAMQHNLKTLKEALDIAHYHISNNDYSVPYKFRNGSIII